MILWNSSATSRNSRSMKKKSIWRSRQERNALTLLLQFQIWQDYLASIKFLSKQINSWITKLSMEDIPLMSKMLQFLLLSLKLIQAANSSSMNSTNLFTRVMEKSTSTIFLLTISRKSLISKSLPKPSSDTLVSMNNSLSSYAKRQSMALLNGATSKSHNMNGISPILKIRNQMAESQTPSISAQMSPTVTSFIFAQ